MLSFSPVNGPIGSDFESLLPRDDREKTIAPWEVNGRATVYLETGRQALSLIAEVLAQRGRNRLLVPGLLCQSMIAPFVERGWTIISLGLRSDLGLPAEARDKLRQEAGRSVLLLAAYFGHSVDELHRELAAEARSRGALVIEDETHRVFRPGGSEADFVIASLRKLLPIGDGAYLQGDEEVLAMAHGLPTSDSRRWEAMDAKRDALISGVANDFRSMFLKENERLERSGRRLRASMRSVAALATLPFEEMAVARTTNDTFLREAIGRCDLLVAPPIDNDVPSHLVLSVADPKKMQSKLATRGIYCAIHWPRVKGVLGIDTWRTDLISVPIDHRYDLQHMARVADAIDEELSR